MSDTIDRDLRFFHDFQESGLSLGRSAVDFVSQDDGRENRARAEMPLVVLLVVDIHAGDVTGEHVGRELNTRMSTRNGRSNSAGKSGLSGTRRIFQKEVSPGEHGCQCQADHRFFIQKRLRNTADEASEGFCETLGILRAKRHGRDSIHLSVSSDVHIDCVWRGWVPRAGRRDVVSRLPRN